MRKMYIKHKYLRFIGNFKYNLLFKTPPSIFIYQDSLFEYINKNTW